MSACLCVCVELGETQDFHQPDIRLKLGSGGVTLLVRIHVDHRRSVYPVLTSNEVANARGVRWSSKCSCYLHAGQCLAKNKLQCTALGQYNLMGSNLIGLCQSHHSLVRAARHAYHLLVMIEWWEVLSAKFSIVQPWASTYEHVHPLSIKVGTCYMSFFPKPPSACEFIPPQLLVYLRWLPSLKLT